MRFSGLSLVGEDGFVLFDVLGGLSDFLLSFSEGSSGVLSELSNSNDLSLVVVDLALHVVNELLASSLVVVVDLI